MRSRLQLFSCLAIALVVLTTVALATPSAGKPNLIVILVDDMGWSDLGCYGGEINTPNIDQLAADGLRFTTFYNTAKCSPTRATLMTGLYSQEVQKLADRFTLPEVLREAGYTTLMTGKWHLAGNPLDHGFDHYFGHLSGATNFFRGDNSFRLDREPFKVPRDGFYTTDANTDHAIRFLQAATRKDNPFFLYIAYNAPHYPLHAHEEDVKKYRGKYLKGWDQVRQERYQRQLASGLIHKDWPLSPRPADVPAWDSLDEEKKREEDFTMATYAAMIDRLDQNIGKLLATLTKLEVDQNTLIFFLSDNGGCPFQRTRNRHLPPWDPGSYWTYHKAWANASNTPYRLYKRNQHEGGISTPLIARWPDSIKDRGSFIRQPGHLVDIMATCIDVAGATYPDSRAGQKLKPLRGRSLLPLLTGGEREAHDVLYFQFSNHRAIRMGAWKLVSASGSQWELYEIERDRTEVNDLASQFPERVEEMTRLWEKWWSEVSTRKFSQRQGETRSTGKNTPKKARKKTAD